jgi:hypothetical protein
MILTRVDFPITPRTTTRLDVAADVVDVAVVVELDAVEAAEADAAVVVEAKLVLAEAGTSQPSPMRVDVFTIKMMETMTKMQCI